MTGVTGAYLNCYGIVYEGAHITVTFSTTCTMQQPVVWITGVNPSTGAVTSEQIVKGGMGCPNTGFMYTVVGASTSYGVTGSSISGPVNVVGGVAMSFGAPTMGSNTGFPQPNLAGGPILEGINIFSGGTTSGDTITDGLWMQAIENPVIGHLHCQGMSGYCEHYAINQPVTGGVFMAHDMLDVAAGLIDLGPMIDNNQTLMTLTTAVGYLVFDETNNVFLLHSSYPSVGEYLPGNLERVRCKWGYPRADALRAPEHDFDLSDTRRQCRHVPDPHHRGPPVHGKLLKSLEPSAGLSGI